MKSISHCAMSSQTSRAHRVCQTAKKVPDTRPRECGDDVGIPRFVLNLREGGQAAEGLRDPLLDRAIGVIYLPETERVTVPVYVSAKPKSELLACGSTPMAKTSGGQTGVAY
jgi:hypothetical protein